MALPESPGRLRAITEDGASVTVSLKSDETTRAGYPFDFELNFVYTLRGNTLELRYRHTNLSGGRCPLPPGFIPTLL